jgi:hypothetical protein
MEVGEFYINSDKTCIIRIVNEEKAQIILNNNKNDKGE